MSARDVAQACPPAASVPAAVDRAKHSAPVPRRALRWPTEVAAALGVSDDWLRNQGLASEIRMVRVGALRLVPIDALDEWLDARAGLPLDGVSPRGTKTGSGPESPVDTGGPRVSEGRVK